MSTDEKQWRTNEESGGDRLSSRNPSNGVGKKEDIILHLVENLDEGDYFKARHFEDELDYSSTEIGRNVVGASELVDGFEIEKWSDAKDTTWVVVRNDARGGG